MLNKKNLKSTKFKKISKYLQETLNYKPVMGNNHIFSNEILDIDFCDLNTRKSIDMGIYDSENFETIAVFPLPNKLNDLLDALNRLNIEL